MAMCEFGGAQRESSTSGNGESEVTFYTEILCASLNTSLPGLINMTEEKT